MKKRVASLALVAALGATGVALTPALADSAAGSRVTKIKDALKGLVSDGTLTQAQADKVATTLDQALPQRGEGPGGHRFGGPGRHGLGVHLDEAATLLGLSRDELRTKLEAGSSLTELAKAKGISKASLVDSLLADLKTRLAEKVKDGTITQAQADARLAEAKTRVGELVDRKGLPERGHREMPEPPAAGGTTTTPSSLIQG